MDSRSIDFAKTASIDLMTLNNKVVNMRQVVKRTKVHVISKLCKHIIALKKKKGTDEQKAKNLRKAERFIEEIDSIKKLKEDKVSKYALANTASFSDISKMSLSSGPRALARLADHPLMKKVVTDFREQHSDWQDLAAYLLIKQTGRRFKTKKQKKKKLAKCVENINASETMTKAYIQERFGLEGLTQAEERFERKRKRPKSIVNSGSRDKVDDNESKKQKTGDVGCEGSRTEDLVEKQWEQRDDQMSKIDATILTNDENTFSEQGSTSTGNDHLDVDMKVEHEVTRDKSTNDESDGSKKIENKEKAVDRNRVVISKKSRILSEHVESDDTSSSENSDSKNLKLSDVLMDDAQIVSEKHMPALDNVRIGNDKTKDRKECVIKELRLEETDDHTSSDDSSGDSSSRESEDESGSNSHGDRTDDSEEDNLEGRKCKKKKKQIPEFLTKASKTSLSDPFFAGSDDDEDGLVDNVAAEMHNSDGSMSDNDFSSSKVKAKSIFYNPHSQGEGSDSSWWSHRGRGRRGSFEKRGGARDRFDKGQRGRNYRGDGRGRGGSFVSVGRGGNFRPYDRKFTTQPSYDKHGSKVNHKDTSKQAATDRFSRKTVAELDTRHETRKGVAIDRIPEEKLHASWEASKRRKAEQSSLTAFRGSKITFADDDD